MRESRLVRVGVLSVCVLMSCRSHEQPTRQSLSTSASAGSSSEKSSGSSDARALASVAPTTPTPAASASNSSSMSLPAWVNENPNSPTQCGEGMLLIEGEFCPTVLHRCVEWIDEDKDRCRKYAPPVTCFGKPEPYRFCIDRFEYPNLEGVYPALMADWFDAKEACETEGKRLCSMSEWTLACEGPERWPYPYGWERDVNACNIDRPRPTPEPDFEAFSHPRRISAEVSRLDLRVESGSRPGCISPFGVRDMTGNVDEWTVNERHFEPTEPGKKRAYVSGLKGGYWGPIRARCRPATTSHNEWFRFYQVGFRCCSDPRDGRRAGKVLPKLPTRKAR